DFLAPAEEHGLKSNIPHCGQEDISDWSGFMQRRTRNRSLAPRHTQQHIISQTAGKHGRHLKIRGEATKERAAQLEGSVCARLIPRDPYFETAEPNNNLFCFLRVILWNPGRLRVERESDDDGDVYGVSMKVMSVDQFSCLSVFKGVSSVQQN
ncbi:hypothetical protein IRJ41_019755, partial [Triplophysa rosa]